MQTRWQSLLEATLNIVIGSLVSLVVQRLVFPLYGIQITLAQDIQIVAIFTVVSIARSYLLRRFFNRLHRGQQTT
jgi:hypothetical protein